MTKSTPDRAPGREGATPPLDLVLRGVLYEVVERRLLSEQSIPKLRDSLARFQRFLEAGHGIQELRAVTPEVARAFVVAPHSDGEPAVATMHLRRAAIRLLYRIARELGLADGDPTLDLELPRRSAHPLRPLTDEEVALCRSASLHTLTTTRPSAAWALAEATATTAEIPTIRVRDLQLDQARVWIPGATKSDPRWGHLNQWARTQLERRLRALPDTHPDRPLIYEGDGSPESRQASSCLAISHTLTRAGLGSEPDIRPASVAAWVGTRLLSEGHPIEEIARRLGKRSLDRTARFIGWDWQCPNA